MTERGVLTVPAGVWDAAVRQAEVIGPLAEKARVGLADADEAAAMLGISRRQVYVLVGRWRAGVGAVSDLLPGCSSGGRGSGRLPDEVEAIVAEVLRRRYLTRPRRSVAAVHREIARQCRLGGLRVPSRGSVVRRIARLEPISSTVAREGDHARPVGAAGHRVAARLHRSHGDRHDQDQQQRQRGPPGPHPARRPGPGPAGSVVGQPRGSTGRHGSGRYGDGSVGHARIMRTRCPTTAAAAGRDQQEFVRGLLPLSQRAPSPHGACGTSEVIAATPLGGTPSR